jgi:hypothetical protein
MRIRSGSSPAQSPRSGRGHALVEAEKIRILGVPFLDRDLDVAHGAGELGWQQR